MRAEIVGEAPILDIVQKPRAPRYPDWAFPSSLWRLAHLAQHPIVVASKDDAAPCRDLHVLTACRVAGKLLVSHRPLWPGRCGKKKPMKRRKTLNKEVSHG